MEQTFEPRVGLHFKQGEACPMMTLSLPWRKIPCLRACHSNSQKYHQMRIGCFDDALADVLELCKHTLNWLDMKVDRKL